MVQHPLFVMMKYTEDNNQIREWMPLVTNGRDMSQKIAATYVDGGTDVNFGNLTRSMIGHLIESGVVSLFTSHEVKDLSKHNQ